MSDTDEVVTGMTPEGDAMDEFEDFDMPEVVAMHASMTAMGSVSAEEFESSQSAIGAASVDGDASISGSIIGMLTADSIGVHQGGAAVMIVDGDASIDQGAACVLVAGSAGVEQGGVGVLVDDSHVVIDTRGALIIGGLLFGGLGLVAVAVFFAGKRIAERIPRMPRMPHLPQMPQMPQVHMPHMADLPKMPDLSAVLDMVSKLRRAS